MNSMMIFYGQSLGRQNIPSNSSIHASFQEALDIFRNLDRKRGFIGIQFKVLFVLQLLPRKNGVRVELLDTSIPAIEFADNVDGIVAERLIAAAANEQNVFELARESITGWEYLKLK